jgi:hypothetical protein
MLAHRRRARVAHFAVGLGLFSLGICKLHWRWLLSPDQAGIDSGIATLARFLDEMIPKLPRTIADGFPLDHYLFDNPLVGFLAGPDAREGYPVRPFWRIIPTRQVESGSSSF